MTSFVDTLFNAHLKLLRQCRQIMASAMLAAVLALLCAASHGDCISVEKLMGVADAVSEQLWSAFNNVSASHYSEVQTILTNHGAEQVNGSDIAQQVADDISDTLETLKSTLQETARRAEGLYSMHQNRNCCSPACWYGSGYDASLCSMLCNTSSIKYISSGRQFGIETGQNATQQCEMGVWEQDSESCPAVDDEIEETAVHIPRDMHEEDPEALCFVQWTDLLTQQFRTNSHRLPLNSTSAQYVGSKTRLLRFFPAFDWMSPNQCHRCPLTLQDTFELGRRPWYTNTVSGDKYFVILLDVSGSMAGFQSSLARTVIAELLKALTPDDYFLILQVGETTRPIGCFTDRARATPENVLAMEEVILSLPDTVNVGRALFSSPVETALRWLGNASECHRVLVIFSDGDRETKLPEDVFRENNDNRTQVFTFLVGYGSDDANLRTVACQNRGAMGRVREYYDVIRAVLLITDSLKLNQPAASTDVHFTTYRDLFGGLAVSMGLPLWEAADSNATQPGRREAFGLVAFDIAPSSLLDALQSHPIGASGYGFIVDNNGQLVTHPLISQEYIQGLSDDDLLSVDMDRYEHPDNLTQWAAVREAMLGGGRGQATLPVWSAIQREEDYVLRNTTYSYAPIAGTPFTFVLVTPSDLWLLTTPTSLDNRTVDDVFVQFSSSPTPREDRERGDRESGLRCLQRSEGRSHDRGLLSVLAGSESTALFRTAQLASGQSVGIVGTTLLPGVTEEVLRNATYLEEESNLTYYLVDETATVVAAWPHQQSGWLYPTFQSAPVSRVFIKGGIQGYELRPCKVELALPCEDPSQQTPPTSQQTPPNDTDCSLQYSREEGCESAELCLTGVEVYQAREAGEVELQGDLEVACGNTENISYMVLPVPNTTLLLLAIPTQCLYANQTATCSRLPISLQPVPCVCSRESLERYRHPPPEPCHNTTASPSLCASLEPRPSLPVVIATCIIATLILNHSFPASSLPLPP